MADWQQNGALKWVQVAPILVLILAALSIGLDRPGPLQLVRAWTFDLYQRLQPPRSAPENADVIIVDLDWQSRAELNQWPWPRTRLASAITKLQTAGADLIVLDAIFQAKDQTSPDQMLETWWTTPGIQQAMGAISQLPDHDALFANALSTANVISSFELIDGTGGDRPLIKSDFALPQEAEALGLRQFTGAISTIAPLSSVTSGNGSTNFNHSLDGRVRSIPLISYYDGRVYPHQILEAIRLTQNEKRYTLEQTNQFREDHLSHIIVGSTNLPVSKDGALYLYANPEPVLTQISMSDVLKDNADLSKVKDAVVFVSVSADRERPWVVNAQGRELASGTLKAEALQQILNQDFLIRPNWARWAETAFVVLIGLSLILLVYWKPVWALPIFLATTGIGGYLAWHLFSTERILVDAGTPFAGITLAFASSAIIIGLRRSARRTYFKSAFGPYLSSGTVATLADDPVAYATKGKEQTATIMVCGLRGLTAIEANYKKHPEELGRLINDFLTEMSAHVHAANGTVNRYLGDHFIATWNAPLEDKDHAIHAVDCALKMLDSLDRLNQKLESTSGHLDIRFAQLEMGIGLSTGPCIAGMMGSRHHEEYSIVGEVMRRANRLYKASQFYGPAVIVSETTYVHVHHAYALLEVDYVERSDSDQPERIFALMGNPVMKANPKFRDLEKSHQAFFTALQSQDWDSALDVIQDARGLSGAMPRLYDIYEKRVQDYLQSPPNERWIGAHPHSEI